jgi:hypothetical protein
MKEERFLNVGLDIGNARLKDAMGIYKARTALILLIAIHIYTVI